MWIVALALRRPYTFVVMALLIIILTPITILRTPVDIFPDINIPVVSVVWNFDGMSPSEMADRIVSNSERGFTVTVNDIEHQESVSVSGKAVIKIFFRPVVNISMAIDAGDGDVPDRFAWIAPGTTPPLVITYTASITPIVQLGLSSKTLPEQQLFDLGNNFLRTQLSHSAGRGLLLTHTAASRGRSRSISIPRSSRIWTGASGHRECGGSAEFDFAGWHYQDRTDRIQRGDERHTAKRLRN